MDSKNKFVFEKFEDFINFLNQENISEAVKIESLDSLQTLLGSKGMDSAGKRALSEIEMLSQQAGVALQAQDLTQISNVLGRLNIPDVTEITSIDVHKEEFSYDNLRAGQVQTQNGGKVGLAQFLTKANRENLKPLGVNKTPIVNKEKGRFDAPEKGDYIAGSGLIGNYIPVQVAGTFDMKEWKPEDPVKNSVLSWPGYVTEDAVSKKAEKNPKSLQVNYVLYYPIEITDDGQQYQTRTTETFVRPKTTISEKLKPIVIQEDLPLFVVDSAELTEDGKNAIIEALSNVATAESISIRGGASQEGTEDRNKELVKLRAESVKTFLADYFPNTKIVAETEGDIQPKDPDTDEAVRKTFRKITLNVNGTTLVKQKTTGDEVITTIKKETPRAQKVRIRAVTISINSDYIA